MKEIIFLICIIIIASVILAFAVHLIIKDFKENLKSKRLFETTLFIVLAFTIVTYSVALFFKKIDVAEQVGSAEAWIGFAGAGMGGFVTMLALYFTLKSNEETDRKNQVEALKPCVVCHILNLNTEKTEIIIEDFYDYGFIKCSMRNVSNNIANEIKITDEFSSIEKENGVFENIENLQDDFGISIYTVSINNGTFLAPQEEYNWKTYFSVELNENGTYKLKDSAFAFKHTIVFEFTDISNANAYKQRFEYEININIDVENKLHLFLEDVGNFMDTKN